MKQFQNLIVNFVKLSCNNIAIYVNLSKKKLGILSISLEKNLKFHHLVAKKKTRVIFGQIIAEINHKFCQAITE